MLISVAYLLDGVASNWFSIGLFLDIPYKYLELYKLEDSLEQSIGMMVDAWLARKQDEEAYGKPSWKKLVEAVASRSGGGHRRLAAKIAKDHSLGSEESECKWSDVRLRENMCWGGNSFTR